MSCISKMQTMNVLRAGLIERVELERLAMEKRKIEEEKVNLFIMI